MAARRLIVVMLVLLFVSSLATALAPVENDDEQTSTTVPATTAPSDPAAASELVWAEMDAGARRTQETRAVRGDQLELVVKSPRVATVELVGLGPAGDVGPETPAHFDVLLDEAGEFPVQILETERRIGTIVVEATRAPKEPAPAPDRARP